MNNPPEPTPSDEPSADQKNEPTGEQWWDYCPNCGHRLENRSCKYRCPNCHYFMSCSDFD